MQSETPKSAMQVGVGDAGTLRAATEVLSGKSKKGFSASSCPSSVPRL